MASAPAWLDRVIIIDQQFTKLASLNGARALGLDCRKASYQARSWLVWFLTSFYCGLTFRLSRASFSLLRYQESEFLEGDDALVYWSVWLRLKSVNYIHIYIYIGRMLASFVADGELFQHTELDSFQCIHEIMNRKSTCRKV